MSTVSGFCAVCTPSWAPRVAAVRQPGHPGPGVLTGAGNRSAAGYPLARGHTLA